MKQRQPLDRGRHCTPATRHRRHLLALAAERRSDRNLWRAIEKVFASTEPPRLVDGMTAGHRVVQLWKQIRHPTPAMLARMAEETGSTL